MTRVNVQAVTTRFPELLDRVKQGEEVAIIERGKPVANTDVPGRSSGALLLDRLEDAGFRLLSLTPDNALDAARLPRHHGDPFDRLLVAQAQGETATLVTADEALAAYDVQVMRVAG